MPTRLRFNRGTWSHFASTRCLLALLALAAGPARGEPVKVVDSKAAQSEKPLLLIEPTDLAKQLGDPKLRVLDTRSKDDYAKGHIPGAVWVDVPDWQKLGKSEGGFRNARAWGAKVGTLGIGRDSHAVVYGSAVPETARVWWLLKYLGLTNVAILNGGWDVWVKERQATDTASPKVAATEFEPRFDKDRLQEIDALKEALEGGKVKVVDARSKDEFTGKEVRGKRGGHIPGAVHLEWKELLDKDGRFKTPAQLQAMFRSRGIQPDDTAACYCQSGGRAAAEAFALELAGHSKVKVYFRSWEQWSADADAPVEK